jgi:hypothetical protein
MKELILNYFNIVLDTGIIPSDWTIGTIVPIYKKKGDINNPDNYRGITLLSCVGKLFTTLLNARLNDYLEQNKLLGEEQTGFRAGYSTLDHVFTLNCLIESAQNRGKRLYCGFVDYRKASDTVDRTAPWQKLLKLGIKGKVLTVIQNMYQKAKSCIRSRGQLSDTFPCKIGVRQGENLSPLLFSIFLNDLADHIGDTAKGVRVELSQDKVDVYIELFVLLYADDTILISETPENLQIMLDALATYCQIWKLSVNTTKTKVVIFSKGKVRKHPDFTFGDQILEVVADYTYLGVIFNYNNSFTKMIQKQISQAKRAQISLISKARRLHLPLDIQLHLYDTCILPILLYGCEIWGFSDLTQIEIFNSQFCKQILRLGGKTVNNMARGELGKHKIELYIKNRMLNYWARLATGKNSKISVAMYRSLVTTNNNHASKWLSHIDKTLSEIELTRELVLDMHMSPETLKELFSKKLAHTYAIEWHHSLESSNVYGNYRIYKTAFQLEPYLLALEPKHAIPLCKFRTNNHYLPTQVGRYNRTNYADRLCKICDMNDTGDEYHYLFKCTHFNLERRKHLDRIYRIAPNTLKMKQLLNSNDVSNFSRIIMDKCKEHHNNA